VSAEPGARNSVSGSDWCWAPTRQAIYIRDGRRCLSCGSRCKKLSLDHVVPRCRGGSNAPENLVTLCCGCNTWRGHRPVAAWRPELVEVFAAAVAKPLDREAGRRAAARKRPGRLEAKRIRDARRYMAPEQRWPETAGVPF